MADKNVNIKLTATDSTKAAFSSAQAGLNSLKQGATSVTSALAAIGVGVSVGGLALFAKSGIDAADALGKMSARTGVAVKTLAEWRLAADSADTSLDDLAKGMQRLALSQGQAEQGMTKQAQALSNLGITTKDPKLAFEQLADAVANSTDRTRLSADLNDVLGRSYVTLLPLLQGGSKALRDSAAASRTFAEQMAELSPDAERFNDQLDELKTRAAGAASVLLTSLVPGLSDTAKRVTELLDDGKGVQALVRAFAGIGKLPFDVIFGNIKITNTAQERIKELRAELGGLQRDLKSALPGGGKNSLLMHKLFGSPEEIRAQITVIKNQIEALEKFGNKIYTEKKEAQDNDAAATFTYGLAVQDALRKAFSTNPIDDFLIKFKDRRKAIAAEYAALKAELSGPTGDASSLDVSQALTQGRSALASGDAEGANAAVKRAKDLFKNLASQEGTAGFEKSYFLRELERLETDIVSSSEDNAVKAKTAFSAELARLNEDATKLEVKVDESLVVQQVKSVVEQLRRELTDNPLRLPIVPSVSTGGLQSVDLSTAALQYGGRR